MEISSLGRSWSVPLPEGRAQRQSWRGTQCPSCSSCPAGHRQPEKVPTKMFPVLLSSHFGLFGWECKLDLRDRIPADTGRAPTDQRSCEDIDWHSPLGRSAPPVPHSAHLGCRKASQTKSNPLYFAGSSTTATFTGKINHVR